MKIQTKFMMVSASILATADLCAAQGNSTPNGQANGNNSMQNVNVVNTPTVNIGNTPSVSVSSLPSVTISGTPTVNVGSLPAMTIGPSSVTHMGVLPSKHTMLTRNAYTDANCSGTKLGIYDVFGSINCFDLASYPGQILMITDWEWYATGSVGQTCYIGAGVNTPFISASQAGPDGIAIKSEHMTSGVKYLADPSVFSNCGGVSFYMQGYLLPNS
jgi:hypothetical protein